MSDESDPFVCPDCGCDVDPNSLWGFTIEELTTESDRQYGVTRWVRRCWNCGWSGAFIAGPPAAGQREDQ